MTAAAGPALLLLNPRAAGGRAARLLPGLMALLRQQPAAAPVELHAVEGVEQALQLLHAWPAGSRVLLAGGDGTLHRMLPALLARRHQVALLPCGTGNDSARALGVHGLALAEALRLGLHGPASQVDCGEVVTPQGAWPFFSSLAAGFDAAVGARALAAPAALRGTLRYLWATFGGLRALSPCQVRVVADGQVLHDGPALFASSLNTRSYGSGMPVVPHARIDDGRLDLLLAGEFGRAATLAMLPRLLAGRHLGHPRVHALAFERLILQADEALPLAGDGEPLPEAARLEVRVRPAALTVVRRR
jgi:diacylglycerol kinase family enzyme